MFVLTDSQIDNLCLKVINEMPFHLQEYKKICEVLYATGCRASEAYELNLWEIVTPEVLILRPKKFNDRRIILTGTTPPFFYDMLLNNISFGTYITYRKLQYNINQIASQYGIEVLDKDSVAHVFRHNYVRKLLNEGKTEVEIKEILGERTLQATRNYTLGVVKARYKLIGL